MSVPPRLPLFLALLAVLAVTRVGHFGTVASLPDASLAVFLLGGAWLGGARCFAAYAATAFAIDVYLAQGTAQAGWCLTPAYGGLVVAYGAVWLLGRWLARTPALPLPRYIGIGLAAVGVHFLIANLSFWAWSGYFADMALADYGASVIQYLPPYLTSTGLYLALAWIAHRVITARASGIRSAG